MVEYFLPPTEAGSRASRHGRPSFITHAAAQGSSTKKRGERPTSHAADALIWKGEDIRQAPPAPLALSSHTLKPRQDAPSPQGPSSLAACSFPPPLPSSVLLSPLCEPLQNAGGNDPSLAFCRQSALFFSSYHTEKEHSLSLARPMLKGSVPRPLPGGGPLPCAARAVRPGISNPMSGRLHDAPGGWRKALPAFGQGGPRVWMPGYPKPGCRACAAGWPVALPRGTARAFGTGAALLRRTRRKPSGTSIIICMEETMFIGMILLGLLTFVCMVGLTCLCDRL